MGLAQLVKPFMYLRRDGFKLKHIFDSGGYPSSHTSGTVALALAIGFKEGFDSSFFAIATTLAIIVTFDSGNVRYYAGKNNKETINLIKELDEKGIIDINDHDIKLKEVLGHKKLEICVGFVFGVIVATLLKLWFKI